MIFSRTQKPHSALHNSLAGVQLLFCLCCVLLSCVVNAREAVDDVEQVKEGNFLLPLSQQPSPLFSLGQNIIEKGDAMLFCTTFPFFGPRKRSVGVVPYFLYGLTDACSIALAVPFTFLKDNGVTTSGLADIFAQIEYAFYEYKQPYYTYQATCLTALSVPTGSTRNGTTVLGSGAPTFLFGGTFSYYSTDWLWFASAGGNLATKGRSVRAGSTFLYQGGFGKNIATRPGWIFTWIIECDGIYTTRERLCSITLRNTGGNVIYLTPSLWVSSERFILQAGISLLPVQHLFGCQTGNEIGAIISVGWKFN